jgi:ADP-ribose pyrophosphatase
VSPRIKAYRVLDEKVVGEGGFLTIRRVRMRLERDDGSLSKEGLYDFVERPMGLDAVVVALWHRAPDGVRVLIRRGLRVPLDFGRAERKREPHLFAELVAGIVEVGEDDEAALRRRAADEAHEEAGLTVDPARVVRLGAPLYPTSGMFPELFHFVACEVDDPSQAHPPQGDGSPFEEGAELVWMPLADALAACTRGDISDLKTELGLRRLADHLR